MLTYFSIQNKINTVLSMKSFNIFSRRNTTTKIKSLDSLGKPILIASIAGISGLFFLVSANPEKFLYFQNSNCQQLEPKSNIPEVSSTVKKECLSWKWRDDLSSTIIASLSSSFISSALTITFFEILLKKFYAEQLYDSIDDLLDKRRGEDSIKQISRFYSTADKYHQEIWDSIEVKNKNPSDKIAEIDAVEINKNVYLLATDKLDVLLSRVKNGWKIRIIITYFDQPAIDSIAKLERVMDSERDQISKSKGSLEIRQYTHVPSPPFFYFNYRDNTNEPSVVKESILFSLFCADETYSVTPGFSITDPGIQQQFEKCFTKLWNDSKDNSIISLP
jgi:hypothetical protein